MKIKFLSPLEMVLVGVALLGLSTTKFWGELFVVADQYLSNISAMLGLK